MDSFPRKSLSTLPWQHHWPSKEQLASTWIMFAQSFGDWRFLSLSLAKCNWLFTCMHFKFLQMDAETLCVWETEGVCVCVFVVCVHQSASGFLRALTNHTGIFPCPLPSFPVLSQCFWVWNQRCKRTLCFHPVDLSNIQEISEKPNSQRPNWLKFYNKF